MPVVVKSLLVSSFILLIFGVAEVLCLAWAVITFSRGEYLTVVTILGYAIACLGVVVSLPIILSGRVTVRGEFDGEGTVLRPDRRVDQLLQTSSVAAFAAMALYAIFAPQGRLDIPTPGMEVYFLFMAAAGTVIGVLALPWMFANGGVSYLRLTPRGFELMQGLSSFHGEWSEVREVADGPPGGPQPVRGTAVWVMADGRNRSLAVDSYTPRGWALREMVRFYWRHPERREELTDARALRRLHAEAFGAAVDGGAE